AGFLGSHLCDRLLARGDEVVVVDNLVTGDTANIAHLLDRPDFTFVEADIASMDLGEQFDIVYCIGVIHHTDNPDRTFASIYKHCKPGGMVIIWTYSAEGNALVRFLVEPVRKLLLSRLSRRALAVVSNVLTALLYPLVYSIYRVPFLSFLPYYEYFRNFRRLSFRRNMLNVFDKLNAPQTHFTTLQKCHEWFSPQRFEPQSISIRKYAGVSYSLVGVKRSDGSV
ncbi:MAG: methyltransferase domain-containing protein, partial [Verrucomicrobiae bacterium]|nr:methyltransferase domain-containing protein [Verrucomicrobiae bacterium]